VKTSGACKEELKDGRGKDSLQKLWTPFYIQEDFWPDFKENTGK
jgi:hypothetical protein